MSSGSGSSGTSTNTTVTKDEIPQYKQDYEIENMDIARDIAAEPYQTYEGERTADFSDLQNSGFDTVTANAVGAPLYGKYDPAVDAATAATTAKYGDTLTPEDTDEWAYGDTLTPSDTSDWMSSYVEEALKPTLAGIDRDALVVEKDINATATGAGAFGDARTGVQLGENDRNTAQLKADATATAYDKAYDKAVTASGDAFTANAGQYNADVLASGKAYVANADQYNADIKNQLAGSSELTDALGAKYGYSADTVEDLLEAGELQQDQEQEGLDLAYEDFINQQEYPTEKLNTRLAVGKGTPYTTTRLTTQPYSSTAQGIGALSSLYGLVSKAA